MQDHLVSIHALMRVRHKIQKLKTEIEAFGFNPRTHESATDHLEEYCEDEKVSIHALMRVRQFIRVFDELAARFQSTHS